MLLCFMKDIIIMMLNVNKWGFVGLVFMKGWDFHEKFLVKKWDDRKCRFFSDLFEW